MNEEATRAATELMALFEGNETAHGTHGEPDERGPGGKYTIKGTARTVRGPVRLKHWRQHLAEDRPLGVIPIKDDGRCVWGCIDYDVYDENPLDVVAHVQHLGCPLVPCLSKSGGLHLFLFLREPEPAAKVQAALTVAAEHLGLTGCGYFLNRPAWIPTASAIGW